MTRTEPRQRRVGRTRPALDDVASRRPAYVWPARVWRLSASKEEERAWNARPGASEKAQKE
jgi:hypothetical protein